MASVFTQIINNELPGHRVYEDDEVIVILTIQPIKPGHVLVIPKAEISHWDDVPDSLLAKLMSTSKTMAKVIKQSFECERVGLIIAGFEVPHTHIHLVPANSLQDLSFADLGFASDDELTHVAEKLRNSIKLV